MRVPCAAEWRPRRDQIKLTDEELRAFLDEQKVMTCATIGPNGRPHLMPLWFVAEDGPVLRGWTYAKSQKTKNLERDPHATLQIETGVEYQELRGRDDGVRRGGRRGRAWRTSAPRCSSATPPASTWAT